MIRKNRGINPARVSLVVSKGSPSVWIRLKEENGDYTRPKDDWGLWQLADADGERSACSDKFWSSRQSFAVPSSMFLYSITGYQDSVTGDFRLDNDSLDRKVEQRRPPITYCNYRAFRQGAYQNVECMTMIGWRLELPLPIYPPKLSASLSPVHFSNGI